MSFGRMGARGGSGSGGSAPLYLGQVANHSYLPATKNASTALWNGRSGHTARDDITALKIVLVNWYVTAATGEVNLGGTSTRTASIEYPLGTVTQVTWSGSPSLVMADGDTTASDFISVNIPANAFFRILQTQQSASGVAICFSGNPTQNTAFGDGTNNSGVDVTMTPGSFTSNIASVMPMPGVVAMTRRPSIFAPGTSRMLGTLDATVDSTGDTGFARMFGGNFAYINGGVNGDTTVSLVASHAKRFALGAYCSHLWLDAGPNDLNVGGRTGAQVLADIATLTALWPAKSKVILDTCKSFTTSSDGWITTAGQTAFSWEAQNVLLNTGMRALTGYNQIVDVAAFQGNGTNGVFWNNPVVGGFQFTTDGKHAITAAATALRDGGIFNPALVHLP